ncbi:MAG: hypothetical protein NTX64_03280 [Elusimicrobia bacterium]|nr:hypothetical protein [Elusimicrobiota bacterium]
MILTIAALTAVLSVPSFAQPPNPPDKKAESNLPARAPKNRTFSPKAPSTALSDMNLKVSFKLKFKRLESSGNFTVQSGTQANYVIGGDDPVEVITKQGTGIEFKKYGTIVNILPAVVFDSDKVDAQLQAELSGPQAPETSLKVNPISTFQIQTEFTITLGKTIVLVDEPDRRVEIKIEPAP